MHATLYSVTSREGKMHMHQWYRVQTGYDDVAQKRQQFVASLGLGEKEVNKKLRLRFR
jgi:hypothetical protein